MCGKDARENYESNFTSKTHSINMRQAVYNDHNLLHQKSAHLIIFSVRSYEDGATKY